MRIFRVFTTLVFLCSISLVANAAEQKVTPKRIEQEAKKQQTQQTAPQLNVTFETQNICAGQIIKGWILVNDSWNPTICGKPTSIVYNVWTIARYDNQPVGSIMQACSGPAPSGWAVIGTRWDPTACGHPSNIIDNVMTIKRLN